MNKLLLLVSLALASLLPAHASDTPTLTHLPGYTSHPGETLDAFVLRVAPGLADFTRQTGFEACSPIGQDNNGLYTIAPVSMGAALGCPVLDQTLPAGFASIGQSIHTHPKAGRITPTQADLWLASRQGRYLDRQGVRNGGTGFSPDDFAAGPGYLVLSRQVLHQAGRGSVRRVAPE